jgi:hypothetical protein
LCFDGSVSNLSTVECDDSSFKKALTNTNESVALPNAHICGVLGGDSRNLQFSLQIFGRSAIVAADIDEHFVDGAAPLTIGAVPFFTVIFARIPRRRAFRCIRPQSC